MGTFGGDHRVAPECYGQLSPSRLVIERAGRLVPPAFSAAGAVAFATLIGAYLVRVHMGPFEALTLCAGAVVLWGPFAWGVDLLVRREVADGAVRFAIALAASYALTSVAWFLLSLADLPAGMYVTQVVIVILGGILVWKRRANTGWGRQRRFARPNWLLLCLVALALFTTAPYTAVDEVTTAGSRNLRIPADGLYYTGQVYELARGAPPRQDPTRAATPARSYHLLPHVTTLLLARAAHQPDLLRAQIVYHLTALTVSVSLVLYALGKMLAGRRLGGFFLVALLYPLAIVGTPLLGATTLEGRSFVQYYFTAFPQVSSMLDPVALSSWQTYSAVLVALGLLLVVAAASFRSHQGHSCTRLFVLAALLVAALSRFRAQTFMVALPGFLLVVALAWLRGRRRGTLGAGLLALVASAPLVLEAGSSHYRPGTAGLELAFNDLTTRGIVIGRVAPGQILTGWPFSRAVHDALAELTSGAVLAWTWQAVCLTAFVVLNVVGVAGTVAAILYFTSRDARGRLGLFTVLVATMIGGSVLLGVLVKSDFDSFSLSGQALFLPAWYAFPLAAPAGVRAFSRLKRRLRLERRAWTCLGVAIVALGAMAREVGPASPLASFEYRNKILSGQEISEDRWRLLLRLRDSTPADSVIVSNQYTDYRLLFSGVAGRAAYLEALDDINELEARRIYGDDRPAVVGSLWAESSPARFCWTLLETPGTHLVELTDDPLAVGGAPCLHLDWSSPGGEARIWRVAR